MTIDATSKLPESDRSALLIVVVCSLVYLFDGISQTIIGPLAPALAATLDLTRPELGPMFSASLMGQSIGLLLIATLPTRFGYRPVLIACILSYGVLEMATGFSNNLNTLMVLRFLTGVGIGGSLPVCMALVSEHAPAHRRGAAVMALAFAYTLGAFLSGLIASQFQSGESWRHAFWIVGGLSSLSSLLILWKVPESPSYIASRAARTDGPTEVRTTSSKPWAILAPSILTGTLLLWFIFVCSVALNQSLLSWLPTILVSLGRDSQISSLAISSLTAGSMLAMAIISMLIDRFGWRIVVCLFLFPAAPILWFLGENIGTLSTSALMVVIFALGLSFGGGYGAVNVVVSEFYPPELRSVGIGWAKSVSRFGSAIAPLLIAMALAAGVAEGVIVSLGAVVIVLIIIAVLLLSAFASRLVVRA